MRILSATNGYITETEKVLTGIAFHSSFFMRTAIAIDSIAGVALEASKTRTRI